MAHHRIVRTLLLVLTGAVAVTAAAGGVALIVGSIWPGSSGSISPPLEYLEGSPFGSYLLPGVVLAGIVGGLHGYAFVSVLRGRRRASLAVTVAAYAIVIWIVVQMMIIPFSVLQTIYLTAGMVEIGLVLLALGVLDGETTRREPARRPWERVS